LRRPLPHEDSKQALEVAVKEMRGKREKALRILRSRDAIMAAVTEKLVSDPEGVKSILQNAKRIVESAKGEEKEEQIQRIRIAKEELCQVCGEEKKEWLSGQKIELCKTCRGKMSRRLDLLTGYDKRICKELDLNFWGVLGYERKVQREAYVKEGKGGEKN